jgi:hypothetical protein
LGEVLGGDFPFVIGGFNFEVQQCRSFRSSGAQCFPQWCVRPISGFAPLEREEIFGGRSFYKHLAPNGAKATNNLAPNGAKATMFSCTSKLNPPMTNGKSALA